MSRRAAGATKKRGERRWKRAKRACVGGGEVDRVGLLVVWSSLYTTIYGSGVAGWLRAK